MSHPSIDATAVKRTKPARYVPFDPSKGTLRAQRRHEALRELVRFLANTMFDELLREADAERRGLHGCSSAAGEKVAGTVCGNRPAGVVVDADLRQRQTLEDRVLHAFYPGDGQRLLDRATVDQIAAV